MEILRRSLAALCLVLAVSSTTGARAQEKSIGKKQPAPDAPAFEPATEIARGAAMLLTTQEGEDQREWPYEGVYRAREGSRRPVIPIGYRVGGTSIVSLALLEAPGWGDDMARQEAVARALGFVLESLADNEFLQPSLDDTYDVRGWGHIYALSFLLRLRDLERVPEEHAETVDTRITWLVDALQKTAIPQFGGWNYAGRGRPSPFMTAPGLQALFHAKARGEDVSDQVLRDGLDALERGRATAGSIAYAVPAESRAETGEEELGMMDLLPGSIGRMVCVESTLDLAGRGSQARLTAAIEAFFEHQAELEKRRKQNGTHIQPYGVAPYYFVFGHYYLAQAIERLEDEALRTASRARLHEILAGIREAEGGWNDRVFPRSRSYGTAMMMLALQMPDLPPPCGYVAAK